MAKKIRKAVIPVAGLSTRFLPASKSIPKQMFSIVDKPIIEYIVADMVAAGIEQIVFVTSPYTHAIEDHFDYFFELEQRLKERGKEHLIDLQRSLVDKADFVFIRQREPLGNGHAILRARSIIGDEPFLVQWGDDLIYAPEKSGAAQLIDIYNEFEKSVLAVMPVSGDEVSKYGCIAHAPIRERVHRVHGIIEKPTPEEAPSNLAQVCQFILTPDFFERMASVTPGKGGELWHVDAIQNMAQEDEVYAYEFQGKRYDCGHKWGLLQANIEYALRDPEIKDHFKDYIKTAVADS